MFSHCYKDIVEHLNRQIRLSFRFEKKQDLRPFHQKLWTLRWSIDSHSCQLGLPRNQTSLQESIFCCLQVWHFCEQLKYVARSTLIAGMPIALLFSLGTCIVQIQSVWVNFASTKRFLNLSEEAIINARDARLCAKFTIFLLDIKQILFLFGQGVYIFEESPKSIQDVIGDVYWPSKYCFNREKCEHLEGYVTTPRSIHGCRKCGARLFVHNVPFMLQEHVRTT